MVSHQHVRKANCMPHKIKSPGGKGGVLKTLPPTYFTEGRTDLPQGATGPKGCHY